MSGREADTINPGTGESLGKVADAGVADVDAAVAAAKKAFKEWRIMPRWSAPYDVQLDKNEEAWTGSMLSDQVTRLNTKTGETVQYLLPRSTNIRRVFVDNSTSPVTFWVGSNHGASIIKLEPLD